MFCLCITTSPPLILPLSVRQSRLSPTYNYLLPLSHSAYLIRDRFTPLQLISSSLIPSSLSSSLSPRGNVQLYIINLTASPSATMLSCHEVYWSHCCTRSAYLARCSSRRQRERSQLPLVCPSWWLHWLSGPKENSIVCARVCVCAYQSSIGLQFKDTKLSQLKIHRIHFSMWFLSTKKTAARKADC